MVFINKNNIPSGDKTGFPQKPIQEIIITPIKYLLLYNSDIRLF